jgi:uncharacterized protein YfaS (alpha-2-macroglobulin family)
MLNHRIRLTLPLLVAMLLGMDFTSARAQGAPNDEYTSLKAEAERFHAEGSYARALALYERAASMNLDEREQRWVAFRLGDTMWRNQNATQTHDDTIYQRAVERLNNLLATYQVAVDRDDLWAEAQESLGDYYWNRERSRDWNGWNHYNQALDYWAGHRDLDRAGGRYLAIVFKAAEPSWITTHSYYRQYVNVPANILENALRVAKSDEDLSHARFLLASAMRQQGGGHRHSVRIEELFKAVTDGDKRVEWYDDALWSYAEWLSQQGRVVRLDNGQWTNKPDFRAALDLYRRLTTEFREGQTQYFDSARERIRSITAADLGLGVGGIFIPGSEIRFDLHWRNVESIELSLHRVDLAADVAITARGADTGQWLSSIDTTAAEKVKSWSREAPVPAPHEPGSASVTLESPLPTGAYVLEARAGGRTARELILVSDATIVLKSVAGRAIAYVCDALDGSPIREANVTLWEARYVGDGWRAFRQQSVTDDSGLASFDLKHPAEHGNLFVAARSGDRQAFAASNANQRPGSAREYRIYAVTDRPAYRPEDTVQWKITARQYRDSVYTTPGGQTLWYEINDPQGAKLKDGEITLNDFGSASGAVKLGSTLPLGEYHVQFLTAKGGEWIGSAMLFRLEEYKLPEYEVTISTPKVNGRPAAFQLGDVVTFEIRADYYFGAPVANADVEVVVHQRPFWFWWRPQRDFPWCYEDENPYRWYGWGWQGQEIRREQLKTDAEGKTSISIETPLNADQDFEYVVEARVVDSSRREVTGSGVVRVTRQKYFVHAESEHNIHRTGESVTVKFHAIDANQNPVPTTGRVEVIRDEWKEIWIAPDGREVTGLELAEEQARHRMFPPDPAPGRIGWRLKYRGYTSESILTQTVKTSEEGEGELSFVPPREGYYRVVWLSEELDLYPVSAQTTVWVCDDTSRAIGYYNGGVEIIVDKDTFRVGQVAPVMITVPANDRYVLFTVEGNDLHDLRLIHVEGTVKLIHVTVTDEHVPNVWLSAASIHAGRLHMDTKQVVVPPVDHFLNVEVTMSQDAYQPGETGSLAVLTTDNDGRPVQAEVGLTVFDESVLAIQNEIAGDPRPFFFSDRQWHQVSTGATLHHRQYVRLVKDEKGEIVAAELEQLVRDEAANELDGFADDRMARRLELSEGRSAGERFRAGRDMPASAPAPGAPAGGGGGFGGGAADALRADASGLMDKAEGLRLQEANQAPMESQADGGPAVRVRSDFRATALWLPHVVTGADGRAVVEVAFPDSTSRWKASARAASAGSAFGIGSTSVRTRQPLIVRLQAPRFFVVGDETVISAVLNNNTDEAMNASYESIIDGVDVLAVSVDGDAADATAARRVSVPANGEARIDWRIVVSRAGEARVQVTAKTDRFGDAMERTYPVHDHGIEKHIIKSGKVRGDDVAITIDLPAERRDGSTSLQVQVTPSMAITMLDALPYLIDYPYGCTEQTMSRFLPGAIVARTIRDLGLDPEAAMARVYGGIESAHADKTHPEGAKSMAQLDEAIKQGLARLADFQRADGGWGWWKESPESDHSMTAYVVWGLALAKQADIPVDDHVLARGVEYLRQEIVEEEFNHDMQAWMLHALAAHQEALGDDARSEFEQKAIDNLWKNRDRLNAYTRALLALAVHAYGDAEKSAILVRNLENGVKKDEAPDTSILLGRGQQSHPAVIATAHWGADGVWWRWSESPVETTAFVLRAFVAINPAHPLIEPTMNWLVKNRRGAQWSNTRDTAIAVLALNEYLRGSGELAPEIEYELLVNGQSVDRRKVTSAEVFTAPSVYSIDSSLLRDGANEVRIVRRAGGAGSGGAIYFAADAGFFSEEEPIAAAGHEIFVRRDYYKLVPYPTLLKGYEYDRVPMKDGDSVNSGERIEVRVTIESKNDYEYLVFEDLKPAGLEAVALQSGAPMYAREFRQAGLERRFEDAAGRPAPDILRDDRDYTGRTAWAYQELRDRQVAMFFTRLPQGVWEVNYELRAEVPGVFHALPVIGHAMYVPEIRCNSEEIRMTVYERPQ